MAVLTQINAELDASVGFFLSLVKRKNTCRAEEKKLILTGVNHGLMEPVLLASETSALAPVDSFFRTLVQQLVFVN